MTHVELISDHLSQRDIWRFLVELVDVHCPWCVPAVVIQIEDLRAYANPDGLRQLMAAAGLSEQDSSLLIYWFRLDGFSERNRTLKEVGELVPEAVPSWSGGVRGCIVRATSEVQRHLLAKKSQLA